MEVMQFVGERRLDFTNRDTGEHIAGVKLYFLSKRPGEDGVRGMIPESYFFRPENPLYMECGSWKIGEECQVEFGRSGKPVSIVPLDRAKK